MRVFGSFLVIVIVYEIKSKANIDLRLKRSEEKGKTIT